MILGIANLLVSNMLTTSQRFRDECSFGKHKIKRTLSAFILALKTGMVAKPVQKSGQLLAVLVGGCYPGIWDPSPQHNPSLPQVVRSLSHLHLHCIVGMLTSTLVNPQDTIGVPEVLKVRG